MKTQLEQSANSQLFSFVFFFGCLFSFVSKVYWQMFFVKYFPFQVRVTQGTISNVVGDVCLSSNVEFVLITLKTTSIRIVRWHKPSIFDVTQVSQAA